MNPNGNRRPGDDRPRRGVPEGLWTSCPQCKATIFVKEKAARLNVCTSRANPSAGPGAEPSGMVTGDKATTLPVTT